MLVGFGAPLKQPQLLLFCSARLQESLGVKGLRAMWCGLGFAIVEGTSAAEGFAEFFAASCLV